MKVVGIIGHTHDMRTEALIRYSLLIIPLHFVLDKKHDGLICWILLSYLVIWESRAAMIINI